LADKLGTYWSIYKIESVLTKEPESKRKNNSKLV